MAIQFIHMPSIDDLQEMRDGIRAARKDLKRLYKQVSVRTPKSLRLIRKIDRTLFDSQDILIEDDLFGVDNKRLHLKKRTGYYD